MADVKRVYTFGNKEAEGNGKMRELLGGKGANLAEMNLIGIPVPPGFTITTEVCTEYYAHGKQAVIDLLRPDVEKAIQNIERLTDRKFGDKDKPLLVSVRSGARASMPGMMDTILNLGMNDQAVEAVKAIPHVLQFGVYGGQAGFHLIKLNGNGADRVQNGLQHFTIIHGILPPSDIQYNRESLGCQGTAKGSGADFRLT